MFGYMVHNRYERMFYHSVLCMIMQRTDVRSETEHADPGEGPPTAMGAFCRSHIERFFGNFLFPPRLLFHHVLSYHYVRFPDR